MKKAFLLITISLLLQNILAQTWAPVGAKWYYNHYSGAPQYLTVIESIGDTLINTRQCRILKTYEIDAAMDSTGAYHWDTLYCPLQYSFQDSGKVYLYNSSKNNFNILYNFNAVSGDTITVRDSSFQGYCLEQSNSNLFQYTVNSSADTVINGITLRKQIVSKTQNADWIFINPSGGNTDFPIFERIGSTKFLFGVSDYLVMEGPIRCLRCYEDSVVFYKNPLVYDTLPCDYLPQLNINGIANIKTNTAIIIYPNPVNNSITIENTAISKDAVISINNIEGQILKKQTMQQPKTTIDVSGFARGMYFLEIKTDKGIGVKKFVKE